MVVVVVAVTVVQRIIGSHPSSSEASEVSSNESREVFAVSSDLLITTREGGTSTAPSIDVSSVVVVSCLGNMVFSSMRCVPVRVFLFLCDD